MPAPALLEALRMGTQIATNVEAISSIHAVELEILPVRWVESHRALQLLHLAAVSLKPSPMRVEIAAVVKHWDAAYDQCDISVACALIQEVRKCYCTSAYI